MHLEKQAPSEAIQAVTPEPSDLALARQYAQRDAATDELWFGALHAANTRLDRAGEKFTKAYLERFAETLPGKPLLEAHDTGRRPIGRLYKAEVQPQADGHFLKVWYFLKADSPLVSEIELGIQRDCSIGYNATRRVCDLDGKEWHPFKQGENYCEHWPLEEYDEGTCTLTYCDTAVHKAEGMEMSFVWVGCQDGARTMEKAGGRGQGSGDRERAMKTIEEAQAALLEAKAAHETEKAMLSKEVVSLKALAGEGEAYRAYLKAEIQRMAGVIEQKEPGTAAQYATFLELLKEASVEQILPTYERIRKLFDAAFSKGAAAVMTAPDKDQKPALVAPWQRRRVAMLSR